MEPQPPPTPPQKQNNAMANVIDDPVLIGAITLLYAMVQVLASLHAYDCTC